MFKHVYLQKKTCLYHHQPPLWPVPTMLHLLQPSLPLIAFRDQLDILNVSPFQPVPESSNVSHFHAVRRDHNYLQ